jgi:transposase
MMRLEKISIVFVVVISLACYYQGVTSFLEISYTVTSVSRRKKGIPVLYKVMFLLCQLVLRAVSFFHHFPSQDVKENPCLPMITQDSLITHERVDDIPLLIGLMQKLHLPEILERHLGNHGNHQGLSNGWLATLWLAYILSESDHRKYTVQDWVERHQHTLESLIGQPIRPVECNDDRLGIVLRRLSNTQAWEVLEAELWQSTLKVYAIEVEGIRLDSTTTYGYHMTKEDGLMQYGHSKDHRRDQPQLKLMAAAAEPSGHLLGVDVHPGQAADDPLYVPLMNRVRQMLGRSGLLYMGDSKMSALATRADIVTHGDYYLMPLPRTGDTKDEFETWMDAVVSGKQPLQPIWDSEDLLGAGYEPRLMANV